MGRKIHNPSIFQTRMAFAPAGSAFRLTQEHPLENKAIHALAFMLLLAIFSYFYFVGASILNVVARKEALAKSAQLTTDIAKYEKDYFAISQSLTPEYGTQLGLSPVSKTAYVYRPTSLGQAQMQHNEI